MNGGATDATPAFMDAAKVVSGQADALVSVAICGRSGAVTTFLAQQATYIFYQDRDTGEGATRRHSIGKMFYSGAAGAAVLADVVFIRGVIQLRCAVQSVSQGETERSNAHRPSRYTSSSIWPAARF